MILENIFWIGGSPCSGKSTLAEKMTRDYSMVYYKCDDFLEAYIRHGFENHHPLMVKIHGMTKDQTWLRPVEVQVQEEFDFYRYAWQVIMEDLKAFHEKDLIVIEGAGLLPELVKALGVSYDRYICLVPREDFQRREYKKRSWVKPYLSDCTDPKKAFENWMARDVAYAKQVESDARSYGYESMVIDGQKSEEEVYKSIKDHFGLSGKK